MNSAILLLAFNQKSGKDLMQELYRLGFHPTNLVHAEKDALEALAHSSYALAIIDIDQGQSHAALQAGKAIAENYSIPIILIGDSPDARLQNKLSKIRPRAYYTRPLKSVDLKIAIENIVLSESDKSMTGRKMNRRWRNLLNNLPGMAYECLNDENWTMLFLSNACRELTGYDPSDMVMNKNISYQNLIHPEDRERVRRTIELSDLKRFELTYRIITKEGQEKWVLERGISTGQKHLGVDVLEGVIVDIDEKMKTEVQLKLSLKELKILNALNEDANEGIPMKRIFSRLVANLYEQYGVGTNLYFLDETKKMLVAQNNFIDSKILKSIEKHLDRKIPEITLKLVEGSWHKSLLDRQGYFYSTDQNEITQMAKDFSAHSNVSGIMGMVSDKINVKSVLGIQLKHKGESYGLMSHRSDQILHENVIQSIIAVANGISNIIARKLTEEKLLHEETRFRTLWEMAPNGIVTIDSRGYVTSVNKSFFKITGYSESEILNKHIGKLPTIPKQSVAEYLEIFSSLLVRKRTKPMEFQWKHKDGTLNWGEAHVSLIRKEGKVKGIQAMVSDITERKNNELKIIESESLNRTVISKSPMSIVVLKEGRISLANPEVMKLMGLKGSDSLEGSTAFDLIAPEYRSIAEERLKAINQGKSNKPIVFKLNRQDGKEVYLESISVPVSINGENAALIMGRDITEHLQAEQKLRENEQLLSAILQAAPLGIGLVKDRKFFWINDSFVRLTGYSRRTLIGQPTALLYASEAEFKRIGKLLSTLSDKKTFLSTESQIKCKSGVIIDILFQVVAIDPEDLSKGITFTVADITQKKLSEKEIIKSYEEIKNLSRHTEEIREEERKQIARNLHDELGQILTAVKMDVSWIKNKLSKDEVHLISRTNDTLDIINQAIAGIQRITSELRPPILDNLGLFEALRSLASDFQQRTGIVAKLHLPENESQIGPDIKISLYRIIQEALTNVMRHSEASRVELTIGEKNDTLQIGIWDNGIGIQSEQIHSSDSLGLIGIKERIMRWNGDFGISGHTGEGTRLKIALPKMEIK